MLRSYLKNVITRAWHGDGTAPADTEGGGRYTLSRSGSVPVEINLFVDPGHHRVVFPLSVVEIFSLQANVIAAAQDGAWHHHREAGDIGRTFGIEHLALSAKAAFDTVERQYRMGWLAIVIAFERLEHRVIGADQLDGLALRLQRQDSTRVLKQNDGLSGNLPGQLPMSRGIDFALGYAR